MAGELGLAELTSSPLPPDRNQATAEIDPIGGDARRLSCGWRQGHGLLVEIMDFGIL